MTPITTQDIITIPGILALVVLVMQLVKIYLPSDKIPMASIALAVVVALGGGILAGQTSAQEIVNALLRGLVAALAAVGTFETVRPLNLLQTRSQQVEAKVEAATVSPHG
jgi:hypothetical protein